MENASRTCFVCSKAITSTAITPSTRAAFVTIKDESWTDRTVDIPTKDER